MRLNVGIRWYIILHCPALFTYLERSRVMSYRSILIVCLATLGLAVAGWGRAAGKIAFTSFREGYDDVWIMNADGSDPVNLTQGQNCDRPAWSPDGTKIAYIDVGADYSGRDLWVIDVDGGNPQQLTDDIKLIGPNSAYEFFWADDGSSIYYYVWDRSEMFVVALDGSGSSLVEWREAALMLRRVLDLRNFSPDETKRAAVAFLRGDEDSQALLLMAGEDRYAAIPLSGQPNVDRSPWDRAAWVYTHFPLTWASNSMRVAFTSYAILNSTGTSYTFSPSTGEIWAVDIDGSNLVNLTNGLGGAYPAWQPAAPSAVATSVEAQSWGRIKSLLSTGAR